VYAMSTGEQLIKVPPRPLESVVRAYVETQRAFSATVSETKELKSRYGVYAERTVDTSVFGKVPVLSERNQTLFRASALTDTATACGGGGPRSRGRRTKRACTAWRRPPCRRVRWWCSREARTSNLRCVVGRRFPFSIHSPAQHHSRLQCRQCQHTSKPCLSLSFPAPSHARSAPPSLAPSMMPSQAPNQQSQRSQRIVFT